MEIKLCYFNEYWNVYMYGKKIDFSDEGKDSEETIKEDESVFRLTKYIHDFPIYTFGLMYDNPKYRPGHGGEWSSNSAAINRRFGTDLWEVAYNQISMAVSLKWLKDTLGDKVKWEKDGIWGEKISEVVGEENVYHKWVTIIKQ